MSRRLKYKAFMVTSTLFITAVTAAVSVYASGHITIPTSGSVLAEAAVPVGVSTVQQMLTLAWSEFTEHLKKTCTA